MAGANAVGHTAICGNREFERIGSRSFGEVPKDPNLPVRSFSPSSPTSSPNCVRPGRRPRLFAQGVLSNGRRWAEPIEALQAATSHAAELLGLSGEIGSIEAGKSADIIAVSGYPNKGIRSKERG